MNKSLSVLQTLKQAIEISHYNNSGVTFGKDTISEINEAIVELEELTKPKQCKNCKFLIPIKGNTYIHNCSMLKNEKVADTFFCAWHEV